MKITTKKLPFTMKSVLLVCFFASMFVFASFTIEDRQKVREWKNNWLGESDTKDEKNSESLDFNLLSKLSFDNKLINSKSESDLGLNLNQKDNTTENTDFDESFSDKVISNNVVLSSSLDKNFVESFDYFASEKEGVIGMFSDAEEDQIRDNFFTINLPEALNKTSKAYLEYDLYGLASHHSVSRSLNHHASVGGEIIVPSASWSHQQEEITASALLSGDNIIMFTSPYSGVKYKIKNLKIKFEQNLSPKDIAFSSFLSGSKLYVKGFSDTPVFINNTSVQSLNGEFEKIIELSEQEKKSGKFSIATDKFTEMVKIPNDQKSFKIINNNIYSYKNIDFVGGQDFNVDYEGLKISAEKDAAESASLNLLKLREKDIPAVSGGLKNVTVNRSGYRVSLTSGKFNKKIKITIPYDEKLLGLFSPSDIKVFAFDYKLKKWKAEGSTVVNIEEKTITFEGDGEGDYINGIISVPESPQLNSLAPTSISGLKAANPVWAPLMEAPQANQSGDANINYPLDLPEGTQGMKPSISVSYSSGNGNGWMGEGWNVGGLSSISVDMRWGTPSFASGQETELYSLDGEMLVYPDGYLPHRHNSVNPNGTFDTTPQSRNLGGVKVFYLRRNHDFTKIERYGNSPADYRWVVTSTNGTKTYYGGDQYTLVPNTVLKNYDGQILQWGIWKVEDVHGNNIIYEYRNEVITSFTGDDQNLNNGAVFHVSKIFYSGRNGQQGPYIVSFNNATQRPDKQFTTKGVLKKIEPYLLTNITVEYLNSSSQLKLIRTYEFNYITGSFGKSILSKMKLKLIEGTYNKAVASGLTFDYDFDYNLNSTVFGSATNINIPEPDAFSNIVKNITTPSVISADNNFEWGWSARVGGGFALFRPQTGGVKNFMISLFGGASYPKMKRGQELIDFNGDGIADIVYRQRNGTNSIKFIPGSIENGQLVFNNGEQTVGNLNSNFNYSKGTSWNLGGSVVFNWFKMGFDFSYVNSESENETSIYMMDANSDGLPDVIKDDKVWFNRKNGNTQEMVITSDLTENMVITGNAALPYTEPEEPDDIDPVKPKNDVVKVWIAPKNGFIRISDNVSMADDQDNSARAVYSVEIKNPDIPLKNCRLYLRELNSTVTTSFSIDNYNDYSGTPLGINNGSRIYVKSGEKVYFRLHKRQGTNYIVATNPVVTYTDNSGIPLPDKFVEEQDGYMPNNTDYDEKFFLNNLTKSFKFTEAANINITIPEFIIPTLSDRVKYSIVLVKEDASVAQNQQTVQNVIYEEIVGPSPGQPTTVSPVNLNYSVPALNDPDESWHLKFFVETDSHINKEIEWKDIVVEGYPNSSHKHYAVPLYPSYHVRDLKNKFDISTLNNIPAGVDHYSISINKNFSFTPSVSGRFMYVIKKKGVFLDKRIIEISNGVLREYTIDYNLISGNDPIPFFHGDPTTGILQDEEKLNILIFCNTNKDRLAYEALKLQLNNNVFNIYNQSGSSLLNHTTETSVNTSEYNGVTAVYHNWGQFLYNEAKDIVPAGGSSNQQPPMIPGCEPRKENDCIVIPTGPSGNSSPAYTTNPNTPKDQYGALINDSTLENPFQFNLDFPACAAITDPQQYGECM